jgi:GTPase involved in cell partitioning and DNA repair
MKGKSGEHLEINVPVGTIFRDTNSNILFELTENDSKHIAVRGLLFF